MEKSRKVNWTKEECTLIEAVETAGDLLRGTRHSANLNENNKALGTEIQTKLNSVLGNIRVVKDIKKSGTISNLMQLRMLKTVVGKPCALEEDKVQ